MTVAMAVGETTGLVQAKLKTNSRFPSPSGTTWSRTGRPRHWKRCRDLSFFLPIRESKMIALFLGAFLKGEIVKTSRAEPDLASQKTKLKVLVSIRDHNGHIDHGVKCSKDKAFAVIFTKRAYWGNKIGKPITVPCKVTGQCGSVLMCLIPVPRGTGIVSIPVPKRLLLMAGIDDWYTLARDYTATSAT